MKFNKFTCGISLGVFIGLLIAPRKGSETREKLAHCATDLKYKINEMMGKEYTDLDELKLLVADEFAIIDQASRLKLLSVIDKVKKTYEEVKEDLT